MTKRKTSARKTASRAQPSPAQGAPVNGASGERPADSPVVAFQGSRLFDQWLADANTTLAFTTYQAGKLIFLGVGEDGRLSIFERTFPKSMGLAEHEGSIWMATENQIWRFENFFEAGETHSGRDALFVPISSHTTGDVDIHDIGLDGSGRPVFVVTAFNCLAALDERSSFAPFWKPPFIDRYAAEDRCHLNGLAMSAGAPKYVTAVSQTNVAEAWREHRADGGVVIDVESSQIVASGLSMPHSPRLYKDRLWLLNAGTGEFGVVDVKDGRFEPVAFCPGFLRGLSFIGDYAVVGMSLPRDNKTFNGLALNDRIEKEKTSPQCGLKVIDLNSGDVAHSFTITGAVTELYDVLALPGVKNPAALGFKTREINTRIKIGAPPAPLEPSALCA